MTKQNIVLTSLNISKSLVISKTIAQKLDMIFYDINQSLNYENFDIKANIKNYEKFCNDNLLKQKKVVAFCPLNFLAKNDNYKKIKIKSYLIYLKFEKNDINFTKVDYNLGFAFDTEDKFCQNISELTINVFNNTSIEDILEKLNEFLSSRGFYDNWRKNSKWIKSA